ncbi:hypothetical protein IFM89_032813 [Coptis chinensis]|uniref:Uncharacterized protein n=1 Tax=Coptis chinensis TaxID=261450 RepID=A0A835HQ81_9MAGN|nr:hypothetical protein IFM89_032813 [Coptis chinensis]
MRATSQKYTPERWNLFILERSLSQTFRTLSTKFPNTDRSSTKVLGRTCSSSLKPRVLVVLKERGCRLLARSNIKKRSTKDLGPIKTNPIPMFHPSEFADAFQSFHVGRKQGQELKDPF